ncbi:hypothetical protein HZS47_18180 [Achromobacter xylosoxidans]|uniref:hypothetical protein n=1 Tax=Alcaligenes xylosoxydans xylosoxydans TaxID=85698 RepID=UPI0015CAA2A1|nr:hypothetical protein [Achromobacter xylosoxidans]NYS14763.1 hypothetical protein [Achromobacter xylosoxidans]
MDDALEIHDYLPLSYPSIGESEYIRFVWEAFESNYVAGKYQFAMLAFHMLYMSYVYFSVWQIKQVRKSDFEHALTFLEEKRRKQLLEASSPFTLHIVNESGVFGFLRLAGCEDQHLGNFKKPVKLRNDSAHPNGVIALTDQATTDARIEEIMQQIRGIQTHMPGVLHACLLQFLRDSANPDEREIADSEVHVEMNFLHKHYLSRKDIEACLACNLGEFDDSPFRDEVQALTQVLKTKAEA